MRKKLHHILILTSLIILAFSSSGLAQDAGVMPEIELSDPERERTEREKIIYSPGEADTRYHPKNNTAATTATASTASKDSVAVNIAPPVITPTPAVKFREKPAPATKSTVSKQSKEEEKDDSILSFNFLYYIIQKYKLQDIVD